MREVQLRRSATDRHRYEIDGVGWLRGLGLTRTKAEAGATSGHGWVFEPRGWTGRRAEALDGISHLPLAEYRSTRKLSHGGSIVWRSRTYELASTSTWKSRFALSLGEEQLLELRVKSFGKQPVALRVAPALEAEPGLVLFACWLCQGFVSHDAAAG